jgi:uncharacterized protein (TIGR02001 family)
VPISEIANSPIATEIVAPPRPAAALTADAYLSLGSQYVYRGVALRNSGPTITAAFTLNHRQGWFVDSWVGQVDARDYYANSIVREWQIELSAGYAAQFNDVWQWSLARAWIDGIDSQLSTSQNYQEWRLNFFYRENLAMQFAYSDNYRQLGWSSSNVEIKYQYALTPMFGSEVGLGHSHGAGSADSDYNYGWAGVQTNWLKTAWNLRWIHSDSRASYIVDSNRVGSRIELTLSWPLPILR